MDAVRRVELSRDALDMDAYARLVGDSRAGAVVTFAGVTRDVPLLRFEAYEPMALRLLGEYAARAAARFALTGVAVAHRLGDVLLGEASVVIAASSPHRPAAFDATRWLIDAIKVDVPIWKQEITEAGGVTWGVSESVR